MAKYDGLYVLPWSAELFAVWENRGLGDTKSFLLEYYGPVLPDKVSGEELNPHGLRPSAMPATESVRDPLLMRTTEWSRRSRSNGFSCGVRRGPEGSA